MLGGIKFQEASGTIHGRISGGIPIGYFGGIPSENPGEIVNGISGRVLEKKCFIKNLVKSLVALLMKFSRYS